MAAQAKQARIGKHKYRVKVGIHQEDSVTYGAGEPAGDVFTTDTNLHAPGGLDQFKDKFDLIVPVTSSTAE